MWGSPLYATNVLLPLINKEAVRANDLAEYSQAGRDIEREQGESRRHHVAASQNLIVGHSLMMIHKLIKWVNLSCRSQLQIYISYWPNSVAIKTVSVLLFGSRQSGKEEAVSAYNGSGLCAHWHIYPSLPYIHTYIQTHTHTHTHTQAHIKNIFKCPLHFFPKIQDAIKLVYHLTSMFVLSNLICVLTHFSDV